MTTTDHDPVHHPSHYTTHPSGLECITFSRWLGFQVGNAFKYTWRANLKGAPVQDLEKCLWYLADAITIPGAVPRRTSIDLPVYTRRSFQRFQESDTGRLHEALQRMWQSQFIRPIPDLVCARNLVRSELDGLVGRKRVAE